MAKIDIEAAPIKRGTTFMPEPFAAQLDGRWMYRLGGQAGLTQFGVNIVTVEPGRISSMRHWHLQEDEFAIVLEGELILAEDGGETVMRAGDCAAWQAGIAVGHHFVNRTDRPARFLVVGGKAGDEVVTYTETDMQLRLQDGSARITHHDGSDWSGPRDLAPKGETE